MNVRVLYMGTPTFALPTLQVLHDSEQFEIVGVVTQPDQPQGRSFKLTPPPVKLLANSLGYADKVWQPKRLRDFDNLAILPKTRPDIIVTAAYGQILPTEWLDFPQYGCLNLHASLLPDLRGASPIATAIKHGYSETGITLMKMDMGLDTGAIIAKIKVKIKSDDTTQSLTETLSAAAAELCQYTLPGWIRGEIQAEPQNHALATKTKLIHKADGEIDWNQKAQTLVNMSRAYTPWPGVFSWLMGKRLKIVAIEHYGESIAEIEGLAVGTLVGVGQKLVVRCGDGAISLPFWYSNSGKLVAASEVAHQQLEVQLGTNKA